MQDNVVVFLHGFLGTSEDWIPIMKSMSASSRCIAFDLPGHGGSKMQFNDDMDEGTNMSMKVVADVLHKLFLVLTTSKVTVVGYSMGARIALYTALRCSNMVCKKIYTYLYYALSIIFINWCYILR